jgi:hypothetical protein
MRLVKKVTGKAGQGAKGSKDALIPAPHNPSSFTDGVVIDGVVYRLSGEPQRAVSHGWGDMSWLYRR